MKKSVSAVATLSLLLAASVGCSSSEDIAQDDPTTSGSSPSQSTTSATAAAPTSATASTPAANRNRLAGDGYAVAIPKGWQDITAILQAQNPALDVAMQDAGSAGFRTNFNVVRSDSSVGQIDPHDVAMRAEIAAELRSVTHTPVEQIPDQTIADELAIGQTSTYQVSGQPVTFIQYLTAHGGRPYSVTMTFATENTAAAKALLATILDSWQWEA